MPSLVEFFGTGSDRKLKSRFRIGSGLKEYGIRAPLTVTIELKESVRFKMISLVDSQLEQCGNESGSSSECDNDLPLTNNSFSFFEPFF